MIIIIIFHQLPTLNHYIMKSMRVVLYIEMHCISISQSM
nr:MAG TPA: hypothetical protein [Caudoviricetes sp.]